jgi:hypothetical protein
MLKLLNIVLVKVVEVQSGSVGVYVAFGLPTNLLKENSAQQNKH